MESGESTLKEYGPKNNNSNISTLKYLQFKTNNSNNVNNSSTSPNLPITSALDQQNHQQQLSNYVSNNSSYDSQSSLSSARITVNPTGLVNFTASTTVNSNNSLTPVKSSSGVNLTPLSTTVLINSLGPLHQTVIEASSFNTDTGINSASTYNPQTNQSTKPLSSSAIMMKPNSANPANTSSTLSSTVTSSQANSINNPSSIVNNSGSASSVCKNKPQQQSNEKFINLGFESLKISAGVPFKQLRNPTVSSASSSKEASLSKDESNPNTSNYNSNNKEWVN